MMRTIVGEKIDRILLKGFLFLMLLGSGWATMYGQSTDTVDASGYYVISDNPRLTWVYSVNSILFNDSYTGRKATIDGREYAVRVREYGNGRRDTTYVRADETGIHQISNGANGRVESTILPGRLYVGRTWYEADSSWEYRIMDVGGSVTTPVRRFEHAVMVRSTERHPPADRPAMTYDLYFAPKLGVVLALIEGQPPLYFTKVVEVENKS